MNKKSIFCLLIIAFITISFVLTACGGDNKNGNETTQTVEQQLPEENTTDGKDNATDESTTEGVDTEGVDTEDTKEFPFIDF